MVARFIRLALLIELAAYAGLGTWLHAARGWSLPCILGSALAMLAGIRLALVCVTLAIAEAAGPARAASDGLGVAGALRLVLGEWRAMLLDSLWYLPWDRAALRPDPPGAPASRAPVVLAHGYFSNRGYFRALVHALEAAGVAPVFARSYTAAFAPIERYVEELHAAIEEIAQATGQPRVVLVCHSMGGLAAREYLHRHGEARVARLVTIASPHHGTVMAAFAAGANGVEMRRGSAFLRRLGHAEAAKPPTVPTLSIYSSHDNLVAPRDTSRLPWARNVVIPGRGHVDLLLAPQVHAAVLAEIAAAGAAPRS